MQQNKDGERKLFRLFGLFNLVSILLVGSLFGDSFENFKSQETKAFKEYSDKNDIVFSNYLKAQWKEYSAKKSPALYDKLKPKSITPLREKKIKSIGPRVNIKLHKPKENVPVLLEITVVKDKSKDIYIDFFGQELGFHIDTSIRNVEFYPQNQSGISNFFESMAVSDYENTLREINSASEKLNLNDWGVYQLVIKLSNEIYTTPDTKKLFAWFLFNKLGYEVKIAFGSKHVILMHYSKKIIYSTPCYTFGNKKFYVISAYAKAFSQNIYTHEQSYPGANKALDLALVQLPNFEKSLESKTLSFKHFGKAYSSTFFYDKNLIEFMATYPQADYETYFNAPLSQFVYEQIATDIKKYINHEHSSSAINFVLNFVQKAFKYETDQVNFGREKVMFANETLYYDKSDCEDRAILFAYLVKKLFKITAIGVKYKDHMSTALYIPMKGDSVKAKGLRFVVADPTYINANIGQSMPQYRSVVPSGYIYLSQGKK